MAIGQWVDFQVYRVELEGSDSVRTRNCTRLNLFPIAWEDRPITLHSVVGMNSGESRVPALTVKADLQRFALTDGSHVGPKE